MRKDLFARRLAVALALAFTAIPLGAEDKLSLQQTDVFVAGGDGYHTYRIPSLLVSKKGAVLAFCEGRRTGRADSGDIDLVLKRSTDRGSTWSNLQLIWDDGANTCGNPCPVLDEKTGTIWLTMTHNDGRDKEHDIKARTATSTRTVWVSRSDDEGATWSKPTEISSAVKEPSWTWYATGPGVGIQIKHGPHRGRLVIPCDHTYDDPAGDLRGLPLEYGSHIFYSDDHGKTWKLGGTIRPKMNECQVVELADGKGTLRMDMRSYFGRSRRAQSVSRDGGASWSVPEDDRALVEPVCQASILRYTWPERRDKSRILFSNPADEKQRKNLTVRLSYDEGKSWPVSQTINAGPSGYSCLTILPNRDVGCLYERGEKIYSERISLARFTLDWLTDGKDSLSGKKQEATASRP